jgi:ABC-type transport system involved in multi-copper enzyme maturation permease subunit
MAFRGGLGPVHAFEWLTATRRWQLYAWRSGFVALLLLGLGLVWFSNNPRELDQIKVQAAIAREFYQTLVFIALVMVLLAAPAATAGAICLDKARGTLFHVLVTDLSDAEIVLGKLAARLVPVLGMVAASLPVLALVTLLGGVDPLALTGSFLVLVGAALLGCTVALALSVWGKKTHEVLLATYLVWILWFLMVPGAALQSWAVGFGTSVPDWIYQSNLYMLTVGANDPSDSASPGIGQQVVFLVVAVVISAALLALAVRRLRPVIIGQWGRAVGPRRNSVAARRLDRVPKFGPTLDGNPVLWREWHRNRPSRWARIVWRVYTFLAVLFTGYSLTSLLGPGTRSGDYPSVVNGFQASIGLLLLSVTSATSLAEERIRGSLDVLLASPLPTRTILWGKWWGAYRGAVLLAILPTGLAAALALESGRWIGPPLVMGLCLAYGAAITSLGLAVATWIANVGRVLTLCVGAVVGVTIGSIPVVLILFGDSNNVAPCAAMVSPFFGVGFYSDTIRGGGRPEMWELATFFAFFWIVLYSIAAIVLAIATRETFDRCLGRMPERPVVPPYARRGWTPERKPAVAIVDDL